MKYLAITIIIFCIAIGSAAWSNIFPAGRTPNHIPAKGFLSLNRELSVAR